MAEQYISKIQIGGNNYTIKDTEARELIAGMGRSDLQYAGKYSYTKVTSSSSMVLISDGLKIKANKVYAESNSIDGKVLTNGDIIIANASVAGDGNREFIFLLYESADADGYIGEFQEFGSDGALKSFAFVDKGEFSIDAANTSEAGGQTITVNGNVTGAAVGAHTYTPAGTISTAGSSASFSGTEATLNGSGTASEVTLNSHDYTPAGTVNSTFTGTAKEHGHTISVDASAATKNYTPAGTVGSKTAGGTVGSATAGGTVSATFKGDAVAAHNHKVTVSGSNDEVIAGGNVSSGFSGTEATLKHTVSGSFSGTAVAGHTHTITPGGTISAPTFTGTAVAAHTHSVTAAGNVALEGSVADEVLTITASFTGSAVTSVAGGGHTPAGTVSAPTFTGTANQVTSSNGEHTPAGSVTVTVNDHVYTPAGTVSSTFTGVKHTHTFKGDAVTSDNGGGHTPTGTITASFTGAAHDHSFTGTAHDHVFTGTGVALVNSNTSIKPEGTVGSSFTGTKATLSHNAHSHSVPISIKYTPAGTVGLTLKSAFSGTQASLTHTVTQGSVSASGSIANHKHTLTISGEVTPKIND